MPLSTTTNNPGPTVRGYIRVSTQAQSTDGFSLAAQRAKIEAWAAYQNLTDVQVYEDAGISGTRDDRPGLTALLLDLRPGDIVVTYALSRLARGGAVQLLGIVRDIRARDARVVFLQENIDTDTSTGRLMLTVLAALAELEIEQTRERTDMGRTQAALQGIYPHGPESLPTGWTTDEAGRIVEDVRMSDAVRLIIRQGTAKYNATADMLNRKGVPSERGAPWSVVQVRRIVQFEGYATGQFVYRVATRPNEPEQHIIIPAPALVTMEEWQAAQRDGRLNHAHKKPGVFPLTGHLRCQCGARLAGRTKSPLKPTHALSYHYVCYDRVRKTPLCPSNGKRTRVYAAEALHAHARQVMADLLRNPDDPAHVAAAYGPAPTDPYRDDRQEAERKLKALLDLFLEQVIDRETYDERRATLTARVNALKPPPVTPPPAMPPHAELAENALNSTNEELSELLDMLDAELIVTRKGDLRLLNFRPLD